YYISDREFSPVLSGLEFNFATARQRSIYALALRKDVKHPFAPEDDTVTVASADAEKKADAVKPESGDAKLDAKKKKENAWLKIDFDGIAARSARVPIPAHNIQGLSVVKDGLLYTRLGIPYYGREPDSPPTLVYFTRKDRKENVL